MREIEPGISIYGWRLSSPMEVSLALVHPWHFREGLVSVSSDFENYERFIRYELNLEGVIEESGEKNVFLFEDEDLMDQSAGRVTRIRGSTAGLYLISTNIISSVTYPMINDSSVLEVVKEISRGNIRIAGSYFGNPDAPLGCCAGHLYQRMRKAGFRSVRPIPKACLAKESN